MKCAIVQPAYLPWRGYFHLIQKSDVFVFFDDVQYTDRDWRNRNRIKTANGLRWLTIPVHHAGSIERGRPINEIAIAWEQAWNQKHLATLAQSYSGAPAFRQYLPRLEELYSRKTPLLADFTIESTIAIAGVLGLGARKFLRSSELGVSGRKTERLLAILERVGADHYISGPAAKAYLEEEKLRGAGITLEYMEYDYPPYEQLYPPYEPAVSILDLLFMEGSRSPQLIWP